LEAAASGAGDDVRAGLGSLVKELLPVVTVACAWNLAESTVLARGLVLESRL
jgi:hypothetical protein